MEWKVGDWVTFDMGIGQITELRDEGAASFSDGSFETSGMLAERFRPLTLRNKNIVEGFHAWYMNLRDIDGHAGFNYPDISSYFSYLALCAMDTVDNEHAKVFYDRAQDFVRAAKSYTPEIDGVKLFRPKLGRASH